MSRDIENGLLSGMAIVLFGFALLVLQCFWFLQDGTWTPLSITGLLQLLRLDPDDGYLYVFRSWIDHPHSGLWLHTILDWLYLPAVLVLSGLLTIAGSRD